MIKKACLFPSFTLIQRFADDLQLHERVKSPLSRVIKKYALKR
jgi:transcription initiation factor TFIIIB Brf1 subunit/transcription initiation factor TFIIB